MAKDPVPVGAGQRDYLFRSIVWSAGNKDHVVEAGTQDGCVTAIESKV
jgi:hypothetical protein